MTRGLLRVESFRERVVGAAEVVPRPYAVLLLVAAFALLAVSVGSWIGAKRMQLAEREELAAAASRDIAEVLSLRARRDRALLEPQAEANLTAALRARLQAVGAGDRVLASVATDASSATMGEPAEARGFSVRRTTVRLKSIGLEELGRFLAEWRTAQPLVVVTGVELSRASARAGREQAGWMGGESERFDATLTLGTVVVRQASPAARNGA